MNELEVEYFKEAIAAANDEFYIDAINSFMKIVNEFPDSDLADDAYYDLGLCYFQLFQFEKAIEFFMVVINDYPEGTISVLNGANEYGHTAAKAWFGIMNCYLGQGKVEQAKEALSEIDRYQDSYLLNANNEKITFFEQAKTSLSKYVNN